LASSSTTQEQQEECLVGSNGEQVCPQVKSEENAELSAQPTALDPLITLIDNNSNELDCVDTNEKCALWASMGECQVRVGWIIVGGWWISTDPVSVLLAS
jgi:hypothetical protein